MIDKIWEQNSTDSSNKPNIMANELLECYFVCAILLMTYRRDKYMHVEAICRRNISQSKATLHEFLIVLHVPDSVVCAVIQCMQNNKMEIALNFFSGMREECKALRRLGQRLWAKSNTFKVAPCQFECIMADIHVWSQ